jgi:hypothetical protein
MCCHSVAFGTANRTQLPDDKRDNEQPGDEGEPGKETFHASGG